MSEARLTSVQTLGDISNALRYGEDDGDDLDKAFVSSRRSYHLWFDKCFLRGSRQKTCKSNFYHFSHISRLVLRHP